MDDFLVYDYASDELGIIEALSLLLNELNILNVGSERVAPLLGDLVNSFDRDLGEMLGSRPETLSMHRGKRDLPKGLNVLQVDGLSNILQNLHCILLCLSETSIDDGRMQA